MSGLIYYLRPTLLYAAIFGLITFTPSLHRSKRLIFLNILFTIILIGLFIYGIYFIITTLSAFNKVTRCAELLTGGIFMLVLRVNALFTTPSHVECLRKLNEWIRDYGGNQDGRMIKPYQFMELFYCIAIHIISFFIQMAFALFVDSVVTIGVRGVYHLPLYINMAMCQQLCVLTSILKQCFKQLNDAIIKQKRPLLDVAIFRHRLVDVVSVFNDTFGTILLALYAGCFVAIVIGSYYVIELARQFQQFEWMIVGLHVEAIFLLYAYAIGAFRICFQCHCCVKQAQQMALIVHQLDYYTNDEIEMISLQIANEDLQFDAYGFFKVDMTLIFSILSSVATYIIILVQLSANKLN